jgi:antitoxin component of MazEF toxin-antitoxin module
MNKGIIRMLALAERMMDEGSIPWVMAPSVYQRGEFERMPVPETVMKDLGLVQGQKINSILVEAIYQANLLEMNSLMKRIFEQARQLEEDSKLKEDFDFRNMLDTPKDGDK